MQVYEVLKRCKESALFVYIDQFQRAVEAVKLSFEDELEGVQAAVCDALYKTCQIVELSNSEHDWLGMQDMSYFVGLLPELMYRGPDGP